MASSNADIAAVLDEIADLLELQGGNAFRVRCYRSAARTLAAQPLRPTHEGFSGLGKELAGRISEIEETGSCRLLEDLRAQLPSGITTLMSLPGMGARRVQALHRALGITSLEELRKAAEQERVRTVRGFSPDGERRILEAVNARLERDRSFTLGTVEPLAQAMLERLRTVPGVESVLVAGSLRRRCETVRDIDLLAAAAPDTLLMERFVTSPGVQRVLSQSPARSSVVLQGGVHVELHVSPPSSLGAGWVFLTGSKAHNQALRALAGAAGLRLNESGLFRGPRRVAGDTEDSIYRGLGLAYIEPELREDRGELEAARTGRLPRLVRQQDLRGDLHMHTSAGDGRHSLLQMAEAARDRGLQYIAVTEHSHGVALGRGFNAAHLARQADLIDELNETLDGIRILKSIEVEVLPDGSLDLPDRLLARLDLVVGSIHERLDLPRERQTERLMRAMDHPYFSILAHPTARVLEEQIRADVDLVRLVRHARQRGCFLELNAQPSRLDLDDRGCRLAKDEGVLVSIASDAHAVAELDHLRYGVGQARRAWLEPADVLNARPLDKLLPLLAATMGRASPVAA